MEEVIRLAHGSGGEATRKLIGEIVTQYFRNAIVERLDDSAVLTLNAGQIAFTTDSYVVNPIFFPGGDIGSLSVNGTVNDLSMVGASPLAITVSLILEEGLALEDLRRVLESMRRASLEAGVHVVGGDTKVVEKGSGDGIFVNTAGIGVVPDGVEISCHNAKPGDVVILSGTIGDHGIAVLSKREGIGFEADIKSDTAPLNGLVEKMLEVTRSIHAMRDPTRGGLATSLNEIAVSSRVGIVVEEALIPVRPEVSRACELLGLDILYVANEGKLIAIVPGEIAEKVVEAMRRHRLGSQAKIIGRVVSEHAGTVVLQTSVGGRRILSPLSGELLPRIC